MFDTLSFGFSAASLFFYFAMPLIQKMTSVQYIVQPAAMSLSMISLLFMFLAFLGGVSAVLNEKSSLYSITIITAMEVLCRTDVFSDSK